MHRQNELCMRICFSMSIVMSMMVEAENAIDIVIDGGPRREVPIDIIKKCPAIDDMIEGVDGYTNLIKKKEPVFMTSDGIDDAGFAKVITVLRSAKDKIVAKDLGQVAAPVFKGALRWALETRDSGQLLELIAAANFLNAQELVNSCAKLWARRYAHTKSSFNNLTSDVKEAIINHLKPAQFLALAALNAKNDAEFEASFRIALRVHYGEQPKADISARAYYEELALSGFVGIPGGVYYIGSPETESHRNEHERRHQVTLSPYWIMEDVVTQRQYVTKMGTNPSFQKNQWHCPQGHAKLTIGESIIEMCSELPVEGLTWDEARLYAAALERDDPHHIYSLVTEAQWEVALRGGVSTAYVSGNDESGLGDYVWYRGNSSSTMTTRPVKSRRPNSFGVYRGGGVREWTHDYYHEGYAGSEGLDPQGPAYGHCRVIRGGGYYYEAPVSRLAYRDYQPENSRYNFIGFRVVRKPRVVPSAITKEPS